jgi:hypothetical protein
MKMARDWYTRAARGKLERLRCPNILKQKAAKPRGTFALTGRTRALLYP